MFEKGLLPLLIQGGITLGILFLFSIGSLAVIAERFYTFRRARRASHGLAGQVFGRIKAGKLQEAILLCEQNPESPVAQVLLAGLREVGEATGANPHLNASPSIDRALEMAKGAMERTTSRQLAHLERYLGILATLGNVSPFVGLLGTVIGIIKAFEAIARTSSGGLGTVSAGIAEALVATAAGLFVAIPAVIAYNAFVGRTKAFASEMEEAASELVAWLQRLAQPDLIRAAALPTSLEG